MIIFKHFRASFFLRNLTILRGYYSKYMDTRCLLPKIRQVSIILKYIFLLLFQMTQKNNGVLTTLYFLKTA